MHQVLRSAKKFFDKPAEKRAPDEEQPGKAPKAKRKAKTAKQEGSQPKSAKKKRRTQ